MALRHSSPRLQDGRELRNLVQQRCNWSRKSSLAKGEFQSIASRKRNRWLVGSETKKRAAYRLGQEPRGVR